MGSGIAPELESPRITHYLVHKNESLGAGHFTKLIEGDSCLGQGSWGHFLRRGVATRVKVLYIKACHQERHPQPFLNDSWSPKRGNQRQLPFV